LGVGCLAASAATTTLDVVTKKNSTNMLFMSTKPAAQKKKLGQILLISACSGQNIRFYRGGLEAGSGFGPSAARGAGTFFLRARLD
jgi:hypothetical protein